MVVRRGKFISKFSVQRTLTFNVAYRRGFGSTQGAAFFLFTLPHLRLVGRDDALQGPVGIFHAKPFSAKRYETLPHRVIVVAHNLFYRYTRRRGHVYLWERT